MRRPLPDRHVRHGTAKDGRPLAIPLSPTMI